jgi:hypothetical protein
MPPHPPSFLQIRDDCIWLSVKVQPRASKNETAEVLGDELKIKVTAPPVDSAANEALVRFLAEKLDCPRRSVQLVRGHTSRHKVIALHGVSLADVMTKLSATSSP